MISDFVAFVAAVPHEVEARWPVVGFPVGATLLREGCCDFVLCLAEQEMLSHNHVACCCSILATTWASSPQVVSWVMCCIEMMTWNAKLQTINHFRFFWAVMPLPCVSSLIMSCCWLHPVDQAPKCLAFAILSLLQSRLQPAISDSEASFFTFFSRLFSNFTRSLHVNKSHLQSFAIQKAAFWSFLSWVPLVSALDADWGMIQQSSESERMQ